jgi:hypothetical protein
MLSPRHSNIAAAVMLLAFYFSADGQTTQGVIAGEIRDSLTDQPIASARVSCTNIESGLETTVSADSFGAYSFPLLSPGQYALRVLADGYQPQELYELSLAVSARLAVRFRMRPLYDVWESRDLQAVVYSESNHVLNFFGPDVDPNRFASFQANRGETSNLDTSVSYVIDQRLLRDLPLLGRDVYSLLVLLPAVAADTTTGRGINVSVAGQRPASSNFLLDGVESNNYLITGPLAALSPEAIQEYRVSTNNYSAEYGATGSFIANAVTRSGTGVWHGRGWIFLKNTILDANGFQENRQGVRRAPVHESDPGASVGGPILKNRLFTDTTFEHVRFRSQVDPTSYLLPTQSFAASLDPASAAGRVLRPYASILPNNPPATSAYATIAPPTALNQTSVVERLDFVTDGGRQRITARGAFYDFSEPGLLFNPYPGFSSGLTQKTSAFALAWTMSVSPAVTNELRASRSGQRYAFDRPESQVPTLQTYDGVSLPGSQSSTGFEDRDQTWEVLDNVSFARANHLYRMGAGWLGRGIQSALSADLQGTYTFPNLQDFKADVPNYLLLSYSRFPDPSTVPNVDRRYAYSQFHFFAQDSFQVSRRLTLNYGVRYEFFGAPENVGQVKDTLIQLGAGNTFVQRLSGANFAQPGTGRQQIYSAVEGNWAGRFAFAFDPVGNGKSVIRGSYGLFYDRPFDNYWQTVGGNSLLYSVPAINQPVDFLLPARQIASMFPPAPLITYDAVLFQPALRAARIQSAFLSFEQRASTAISFQVLGIGSFGRDLATTDQINRQFTLSVDPPIPGNRTGLINPQLPLDVLYRANQGKSDYLGGSAVMRFRSRMVEGQISYTLSHAIDNQSDPLSGAFQDFNFGNLLTSGGAATLAAFTRQFDSQSDRANADFDQRQNLVYYSVIEVPPFSRSLPGKLLSGWRIGSLAALRSGFPYSVYGPQNYSLYRNNRLDLVTTPSAAREDLNIPGGKLLLNSAAFAAPPDPPPPNQQGEMIGNVGRNAFTGPGLFNVDLSVARSFGLARLGEAARFTLRADLFNVLNHANLGNPCSSINCPFQVNPIPFGAAYYGRTEVNNGFPLLLPLTETARQVQLMLRIDF